MPGASQSNPQDPLSQLLAVITDPDKHSERITQLNEAKAQADERLADAVAQEAANSELAQVLTRREQAVAKRENEADRREKNLTVREAFYQNLAAKWNALLPQIAELVK